jgi:hypothetical protein
MTGETGETRAAIEQGHWEAGGKGVEALRRGARGDGERGCGNGLDKARKRCL